MKIAVLGALSLAASVTAESLQVLFNNDDYILNACIAAIEKVAVFCADEEVEDCYCESDAELQSIILCAYNHTAVEDPGMDKKIVKLCPGLTTELVHSAYKTGKKNAVKLKKGEDGVIDYPIKPSSVAKKYPKYYITYHNNQRNTMVSHAISWGFMAFVGLVMLVAGAINWAYRLIPGLTTSTRGKASNLLEKYYIMPPTVKRRHNEATVLGLLPDRFESIMIFFLWAFTFISAFVGMKWNPKDAKYKKASVAYGTYIGNRTGIIIMYQIPLLILFAGRNNFLLWITRWKYSRFIAFHRWLARSMVVQLLIHTIAFTIASYGNGKIKTRILTGWFRLGIVGAIGGILAAIVACYTLRTTCYTAFLYLHILFVAIFVYGTWRHVDPRGYIDFMYAIVAIWVVDYVFRICRTLLFGGFVKATVEVVTDDLFRFTIKPSSAWSSHAGQHAFVRFLTPTTFWASNPFTIIQTADGQIQFNCRVKRGVTDRIKKYVQKQGGKAEIRISVDGPYGEVPAYHHYQKAVFMANGNGFPSTFPLARDTLKTKTEVKFYWGVRDHAMVDAFQNELEELKALGCQPIVYISDDATPACSSANESGKSESDSGTTDDKNSSTSTEEKIIGIDFKGGRIPAKEVVQKEMAETDRSVVFGVCCVPPVADSIRATIVDGLGKTSNRVDFFDEAQIW